VPWWRWLDATREIDLVEEIGRVHGLEHVPAELPPIPPGIGGLTREQQLRRRIEDHLSGAGLREVVTLSLVDPDERQRYRLGKVDAIKLRNPLSTDLSELRVSLLPSLLEVVRRNRAVGERDVQAFEVGRVHRPGGESELAVEEARLGIVLSGNFGGEAWTGSGPPADFGSAVAVVDTLLARLGIEARRERETGNELLHPGRAARVVAGERVLGVIGEIHPGVAVDLELEGPIALAEFDLTAILASVPGIAAFGAISQFPPARQDIAVVVADEIEAADLVATVRAAGGELVVGVEVFDVYRDVERLGAGRVSVALHVVFQAADRTLTDDEAAEVRERIIEALVEVHGAELRG
jgi:phenylalanyl-tRNA synthetase beta chain